MEMDIVKKEIENEFFEKYGLVIGNLITSRDDHEKRLSYYEGKVKWTKWYFAALFIIIFALSWMNWGLANREFNIARKIIRIEQSITDIYKILHEHENRQ